LCVNIGYVKVAALRLTAHADSQRGFANKLISLLPARHPAAFLSVNFSNCQAFLTLRIVNNPNRQPK